MKKIGLCLSGGGARGFAHLGVLQAFDELAIPIHELSGSSAGAFAAALYGQGHKPEFILKEITSRMGLLKLTKTEKILKELIPHDSFEGLNKSLVVCATNMSRGIPAYFTKGKLIETILASASIPLAFRPIIINGDKHYDGGISDNLPLAPLKDSDLKIAVNVTPFEKRLPVRSMKDAVFKSVYISIDHQTREQSQLADLVIIPEGIMKFDGFKLKYGEKLFETGYNTAIKVLKEFKF
jgi:NTE family protein